MLRYSIPAFRLPEAGAGRRAAAAVGGRRALRRRRRARRATSTRRPARRPASTPSSWASAPGRPDRRASPARKAALDGLEFLRATCATARSRAWAARWPCSATAPWPSTRPASPLRLGATRVDGARPPRRGRRATAGAARAGGRPGRGRRVRVPRRGPHASSSTAAARPPASSASRLQPGEDGKLQPRSRLALRRAGRHRASRPSSYMPDVGRLDERARALGLEHAGGQPLHRPHQGRRRVRRRRCRHRRQVRHPRGRRRQARRPGDRRLARAATTSRSSRAKLAVYAGLPYLEQLADAAKLGDARRSGWPSTPGVAQDGRRRRARRAHEDARCAGGQARRLLRRGRKGPRHRRPPRPRRPAACSASATPTARATCSASASSTTSPRTSSWSPRRAVVPRPRAGATSTRSSERDMDRCIACGRCVRVCRDVAGPACYDFSGRGFMIEVDTPYGESLQLADCITCGRCVTACPTGALTFNQRALRVVTRSTSRAASCATSASTSAPSTPSRRPTSSRRRASSGTTLRRPGQQAGRRAPHVRRLRRPDRRASGAHGHRATRSSSAAATGCLEVSTTIYPYTSWTGSYIHTAFENAAATLVGVETAFRSLKKQGKIEDNVKFIAFGGDGGTYDIGLQSLSGAMERGHDMRLRLLRQRRLHEHRLPALRRHAARRLDDHEPGGQGAARQDAAAART